MQKQRNHKELTCYIGSRTSVWTTSHTHHDSVVTKTVLFTYLLNFIDKQGKILKSMVRET